jgi:LppX_LprAFG lipoprotein
VRRLTLTALIGVLAVLLAACGGGSNGDTKSPSALLAQAKTVLDRTQALHFVLTSQAAKGGHTTITGGSGDLARPDQVQGVFHLTISGFSVSVKVLAGGGKFYAEPPFQSHYTLTNPATYGVGNPALFLDPNHGLSTLLVKVRHPKSLAQTRIDGEVVDQIQGSVPGREIPVLPDAVPARMVTITAAINPSTHQLRRVTLVGPFTSPADSTFTVVLTGYGEKFHVVLPTS